MIEYTHDDPNRPGAGQRHRLIIDVLNPADLLGISISIGMIAKLQRQAGEVLDGPMAEITEAVRQAKAVHVDETGWRECGRKAWLWVGATAHATAFRVHRSRGHDALEALLGAGPRRDQVIISDRFPTYARAPNRQLSWAHLRRDMQAMIDRRAGGKSVGRRLLDQSRWVFTWWGRLGEGSIARPTLRSYGSGLKGVVGHLLREGAACGCAWTSKVCRKILEAERHLWTFAEVDGVAPDNNAAECAAAESRWSRRAASEGEAWRPTSRRASRPGGAVDRFPHRCLDQRQGRSPIRSVNNYKFSFIRSTQFGGRGMRRWSRTAQTSIGYGCQADCKGTGPKRRII